MSEDFWSRDCQADDLLERFECGAYQFYVNGFTPGRIGYVALHRVLEPFFERVWQHPGWKFRPPASLNEAAAFVKMFMLIVNRLFEWSDYSAPIIGGRIQLRRIPRPPNALVSCRERPGESPTPAPD